eukprot:1359591-Amorphochlora_amoeboformis.AAC.1
MKVAKNNQRGARKINNLKRFKFSLAFENSETPDYITEKFFGSLVAILIEMRRRREKGKRKGKIERKGFHKKLSRGTENMQYVYE